MTTREPDRSGPAYATRPRRSRAERLLFPDHRDVHPWDHGWAACNEVEFGEVEALLRVERSA